MPRIRNDSDEGSEDQDKDNKGRLFKVADKNEDSTNIGLRHLSQVAMGEFLLRLCRRSHLNIMN